MGLLDQLESRIGVNFGALGDFSPPEPQTPPPGYAHDINAMPYEARPVPRTGETLIADAEGDAGLVVRDGAVGLMGRGGCALQLQDNLVAASHLIKLRGRLILFKGDTRLKGSLRSLETLSTVGLEAKQLQLRGESLALVSEQQLYLGGGQVTVTGDSLTLSCGAASIKLTEDAIELNAPSLTLNGITNAKGIFTANGSMAQGHFPGPFQMVFERPEAPERLPAEEDPETANDRYDVAAGRLVPG
jgi:hypothetical protein